MAPSKLDLYAEHRDEYVAPREPTLVDVGPARHLAITGKGKPGGPEFSDAVGALYNVSFTVKMASKAAGSDYAVSKLEGLWWKEGPSVGWTWQLLIRVPEFITKKHLAAAVAKLRERESNEVVSRVTLETLDEGKCVQVLHVGPYTAEEPTLAKMRKFAADRGLSFTGRHHEIYLSDPRRVDAEKLRTILRQPVVG
ncbi:MAG: GyrI-like domain-containing protein [Gemmatimonadaceae bacterium]